MNAFDILGENLGYLLGWVALGETLGDDDDEEAARAMGAAIVEEAARCHKLHTAGAGTTSPFLLRDGRRSPPVT